MKGSRIAFEIEAELRRKKYYNNKIEKQKESADKEQKNKKVYIGEDRETKNV